MGYSAAAILDCMQQYEKILEKTTHNNLLVQACKLYAQCDYIKAAFKAVAYFTYKITMPFLNCVEQCDQNELLPVLKQLYDDLKEGKMDTLSKYGVQWTHINTDNLVPVSPLDNLLLKKMCLEASKGIHLQCAREYWETSEDKQRATALHELSEEERKNIPTENLSCERYLARFGNLASLSAARSNRFFKGKRIRDDLMFQKSMVDEESVTDVTRNIIKELKSMGLKWTDDQKQLWKEKIQKSMNNNIRMSQHKDLLLKRCKKHGGPLTSIAELKVLTNEQSDDEKTLKSYLRAEVGFQKALHPFDARERSHLYKMNYLSVEGLTENLTILLDETLSAVAGDELVQFPNEEEIYDIVTSKEEKEDSGLKNKDQETELAVVEEKRRFVANEPVAVIWDTQSGKRCWFIGFFICDIDEDTVKIDHLHPQKKGKINNWIRPKADDVQAVDVVQLLPIEVVGDWNFCNECHPVLVINNATDIDEVFQQYLD